MSNVNDYFSGATPFIENTPFTGEDFISGLNPYLTGFKLVSGLFGGGSKVEMNQTGAGGFALSGKTPFDANDSASFGGAIFDFDNPLKIALIGGAVLLAVYVIKKRL